MGLWVLQAHAGLRDPRTVGAIFTQDMIREPVLKKVDEVHAESGFSALETLGVVGDLGGQSLCIA